jgi:hypothetical protein
VSRHPQPMPTMRRLAIYEAQNGCQRLTGPQRRRVRQKGRAKGEYLNGDGPYLIVVDETATWAPRDFSKLIARSQP